MLSSGEKLPFCAAQAGRLEPRHSSQSSSWSKVKLVHRNLLLSKDDFFLKIPGGGGGLRVGGGGEGPGGCLQGIKGMGAKYFFRGRKAHQVHQSIKNIKRKILCKM